MRGIGLWYFGGFYIGQPWDYWDYIRTILDHYHLERRTLAQTPPLFQLYLGPLQLVSDQIFPVGDL